MPRIRKLYNRSYMSLNPNDAGKTILAAVQRFHTHNKLIDVRVVHFGRQLAIGHKTIFAAFSSYFESLLKDVEGERRLILFIVCFVGMAVLNVDSIDPTHVRHIGSIVDFMYGRVISITSSTEGRELLDAARTFGVSSLCKSFSVRTNISKFHLSILVGECDRSRCHNDQSNCRIIITSHFTSAISQRNEIYRCYGSFLSYIIIHFIFR